MKHVARRRFGQNFLIDKNIIEAIVTMIAPQKGDRLVEIGPGQAALTSALLEHIDSLDAIEIDRDLVSALAQRFDNNRLRLHCCDALSFDFSSLTEEGETLRIIGNLPYNISTPLLFYLAGFAKRIKDMHFMLQQEVVDRIVAAPGSSVYGRLSVMLQYRFITVLLLEVTPEAFRPIPKVNSAVIRMLPRPQKELLLENEMLFANIVNTAFSQRRKMLRNTLKGICSPEILIQNGIDPTARAEELSVTTYVQLSNYLNATKQDSSKKPH